MHNNHFTYIKSYFLVSWSTYWRQVGGTALTDCNLVYPQIEVRETASGRALSTLIQLATSTKTKRSFLYKKVLLTERYSTSWCPAVFKHLLNRRQWIGWIYLFIIAFLGQSRLASVKQNRDVDLTYGCSQPEVFQIQWKTVSVVVWKNF